MSRASAAARATLRVRLSTLALHRMLPCGQAQPVRSGSQLPADHTACLSLALCAQDFAKDDVKLFKRSLAFYEGLAGRLGAAGHCLDVFACSLDQVGLAEMHPAVASTGALLPVLMVLLEGQCYHAARCTMSA